MKPTEAIELATDLELFLLEDEGLLFSERLQSIYSLNTMACFIWLQAEDGLSPDELSTALVRTFSLAPETAAKFLKETLDQWRVLGFLAGGQGAGEPLPQTEGASLADDNPTIDRPGGPLTEIYRSASYAVLGRAYCIRFPDQEVFASVEPVLRHLCVSPSKASSRILDIMRFHNEFQLVLDGNIEGSCVELSELAPLILSRLFWVTIPAVDHFCTLHAAALTVETPETDLALLLPAKGGSGKTTLSAGLVKSGLGFLTDDVCLLAGETLAAQGLNYPFSIKQAGVAPLQTLYPALPQAPIYKRPDGVSLRYLRPECLPSLDGGRVRFPVQWIMFPQYQAGVSPQIEPLGRPMALRRLMEMTSRPRHLDHAAVRSLVNWIKGIECFDLTVSELSESVALVRSTLNLEAR